MQQPDGKVYALDEVTQKKLRAFLDDEPDSPEEVTIGETKFFKLNRHERRMREAQRRKRA
jgi:hypothetical protein